MTEESHRNHGLARSLIEYVLEDYKDKVDDIDLFGNDFAKEFYLKRGFKEGFQYRYFLTSWKGTEEREFEKADQANPMMQKLYLAYIRRMKENSAFEMHNYGLMTFWAAGMENIYYSKKLGCYISAEIREDTLYLNSIISLREMDLLEILKHMGPGFSKVVLMFTPREAQMGLFETSRYQEKDCNFLYLGEQLDCVEEQKLFFPIYSHA